MPIISTLAGVTSSMFAIEGILLNGYAIHVARKFDKDRTNASARKVFLTSLWYLPCWMILFLLHSRKWMEDMEEEEEEAFVALLRRKVDEVREKGRELCIHEILVFGTDGKGHLNSTVEDSRGKDGCPILLGKETAKQASESAANTTSKLEGTEA
eukprot:CAMPEP_0197236158 /NCGR_PEP_ID=MMETSP1429-20130617/3379_1 /TAXON_ID=49237 /ORGANISM="Chaetoceros  sp., Strain UNC1202" /LENGTH=154 /DNA_ID=CAMNT_0042694903 /DNA_START=38 /DNA_END=502 /DNA_ORIENTATION=-